MSTRESILRYNLIIKKLQHTYASFEEIKDYLEVESEIRGDNLHITKRSFQRYLNVIRDLYGKDIAYDRNLKAYFIQEEVDPDIHNRMLDAFEIFNLLHEANDFKPFLSFETRRAQGFEHLIELLRAIKNKHVVKFSYHKFWEEDAKERILEPIMLKEFKGRWYLLANDKEVDKIKSFGLDRISQLLILNKKFSRSKNFNHEEYFHGCFGIISKNSKPEKIVLSFEPLEGKYIKSYPLHASQKVLVDDEKEYVIQLKLCLSYDLMMELLSYGGQMKVVSPLKLRNMMKKSLEQSLKNYL